MLKLICSAVLCICLLAINATEASADHRASCSNGVCQLPGRPVARIVTAASAIQPIQRIRRVVGFVRPVQRLRNVVAIRPFQRVRSTARSVVRSLICR